MFNQDEIQIDCGNSCKRECGMSHERNTILLIKEILFQNHISKNVSIYHNLFTKTMFLIGYHLYPGESSVCHGCRKSSFYNPMLFKQVDVLSEYQGVLQLNGSFVKGCYERASQVDTQFFGIKEDGGCWTSKNKIEDFTDCNIYRRWTQLFNCKSGIGGQDSIFIYELGKM